MIKRGDFTKGSLAADAPMMLPRVKQSWQRARTKDSTSQSSASADAERQPLPPFTEMCLFSMISPNFQGEKLHYNQDKMASANCKEANAHLRSLYAYNKEYLP